MKKNVMKTTALALSAAILIGVGATAVCAQNNTSSAKAVSEKPSTPAVTSKANSVPSKDETVYVLSGADGTAKQILVSNWLQNTAKADQLEDLSHLKGIENVKGNEEYTTGKDGSLIWDAAGEDIYYQGTSDQQVPVDMQIHYTLDGKEITPEELAGKTGKVTIRFDYQNHQFETATIDGKQQKIYVPFVMLTGVMLDTDVFRNVTVTNGKLENLGNTIAVIGAAMPGMQENLGISKDDFHIPDYVEITADVTDFDMGPTLTIATTSLLSNLNAEDLDIDNLKDQAQKLVEGMNQLMDGSGKLYDGLNTLMEKSGTLVDGIDQLAAGATQLQSGADALNGGASQLQSGASQLSAGLNTLDSNSAALNSGAQQVFNTLLATANTQLTAAGLSVPGLTIGNYADVLNGIIASLDETAVYQSALQQVTEGVNARRSEIEAKVTQVVKAQVSAQVTAQVTDGVRAKVTEGVKANEEQIRAAVIFSATQKTPEEYQAAVDAGLISEETQATINTAVEAAISAKIEEQMESDDIKAQIADLSQKTTEEQMASEEIKATIAQNVELQVEKAISDTMASPEIQAQLQAAAEGAKAVIALKSSLDSYNGFYLGVLAYTSGVSSATAGANELIAGANTLKGGMDSLTAGVNNLNSGIQTMKSKTPELVNGITALRDGSKALDEGLTKLMNEGIQKIADLAEDDLEDLTARLSACINAAKGYTTFSGISQQTEGTVKFIYKTDSISSQG